MSDLSFCRFPEPSSKVFKLPLLGSAPNLFGNCVHPILVIICERNFQRFTGGLGTLRPVHHAHAIFGPRWLHTMMMMMMMTLIMMMMRKKATTKEHGHNHLRGLWGRTDDGYDNSYDDDTLI